MFDRGDFYRAWLWNKRIPPTKRGRIMQLTQANDDPFNTLMMMTENTHPEVYIKGQKTACLIMFEFDEFMENTRIRNRVMKRWCEFARLNPRSIPKYHPTEELYFAKHGYAARDVPQKTFNDINRVDWTLFYSTLLGIPA